MSESQIHIKWRSLVDRGSIRDNRPIQWPKPYVLQKADPVRAAQVQIDLGYIAEPSYAPVPLCLPFDWSMDPFKSRPWRTRLMCLQPLDCLLFAYQESGDQKWLSTALELLFDWIDRTIVRGRRGSEDWLDMPVGYRAMKLAYVLDLAIAQVWQPSSRQLWLLLKASDLHILDLSSAKNLSYGNHGVFQLHGLAILSQVYWTSRHKERAANFLQKYFPQIIRQQFNEEGVHLEHSPGYHWWMAGELRKIFASGWHEEVAIERVLSRAEEVGNWFLDTNGRMLPLGDTSKRNAPRLPAVSPRPDFQNACYAARMYPRGGYAFARSQDSLFAQTAAYHSKAHKHSDDLHFELHSFGRPVLTDASSTGYRMNASRKFVLSTRAHNTVQVDDLNYPRDGVDKFNSALQRFECFEHGIRVVGKVHHRSLGVMHRRRAIWCVGRFLVIEDSLRARQQRRFTQWFHFAPEWTVSGSSDNRLQAIQDSLRLSIISGEDVSCRMHYGETEPVLNGWRAVAYELVPAWSVGFVRQGERAEFRTVFDLDGSAAAYLAGEKLTNLLGSRQWVWCRGTA